MLSYHERSGERLRRCGANCRPRAAPSAALGRAAHARRTTAPPRRPDPTRATRWREDMSAADLAAFEEVAGQTLAAPRLSGPPTRPASPSCCASKPASSRPRGSSSLARCGASAGASQGVPSTPTRRARATSRRLRPRTALQSLGVEVHTDVLNTEHDYYPFANKIYAAAAAERELAEDVIVFCDSDTVFLSQPDALDLEPEGRRRGGAGVPRQQGVSTGPEHRMERYWERVWEIAGVDGPPPYIETVEKPEADPLLLERRHAGRAALVGLLLGVAGAVAALLAEEHFPEEQDDGHGPGGDLGRRRAPARIGSPTSSATYNYNIGRRPLYIGRDGRGGPRPARPPPLPPVVQPPQRSCATCARRSAPTPSSTAGWTSSCRWSRRSARRSPGRAASGRAGADRGSGKLRKPLRQIGGPGQVSADTRPRCPFIVGVPRSGTTMLRLMLDAHPDLADPARDLLRDQPDRGGGRRRRAPTSSPTSSSVTGAGATSGSTRGSCAAVVAADGPAHRRRRRAGRVRALRRGPREAAVGRQDARLPDEHRRDPRRARRRRGSSTSSATGATSPSRSCGCPRPTGRCGDRTPSGWSRTRWSRTDRARPGPGREPRPLPRGPLSRIWSREAEAALRGVCELIELPFTDSSLEYPLRRLRAPGGDEP